MKVLFDGDILVFRCGFAAERNRWFLSVGGEEPEVFSYKKEADARLDELVPGRESRDNYDYQLWSERYVEPVENALHNVKSVIRTCLEELETDDITVFLSGSDNYRYEIAKTRPYKGNRDAAHRPTHEVAIREYIENTYPTVVSYGEEADDALGITQLQLGGLESVIATTDKDLHMIPGLKYNFVKKEKVYVTEDEGMRHFFHQLLTGDVVDNIPGLPGIGKVKADRMLYGKNVEEQWYAVVQKYMEVIGEKWLEYLTEQGRLLWIRREPGEMWTPNVDTLDVPSTGSLTLSV